MDQHSCRNKNIITGIIACLLLAGIPAAMAAPQTVGGEIIINSNPPGAAVDLSGVYRGVTPIRLENVTPGEYLLGVRLAGYKNWTFPLTLYDGSTREIGVNLEDASSAPAPGGFGSIAIDSSPGGARVTLDGNATGTTPLSRAALILNSIAAGSHTVTVELAGYPLYTSTVTVLKNKVVQVNADFITETTASPATPAIPGTPVATTDRPATVPLSPLTVLMAAGLAGLAAVFRRS